MRQDADFFGEIEPELIYIAKRLHEAQAVEDVLMAAEVVEPDRYRGGFIFQSERIGAFFYVHPEAAARARELLTSRGYRLPE